MSQEAVQTVPGVPHTPAEQIVEKIVQALPMHTVLSHFAPNEITDLEASEKRQYDDDAIRFQLFTDLINGDKTYGDIQPHPVRYFRMDTLVGVTIPENATEEEGIEIAKQAFRGQLHFDVLETDDNGVPI
jgi:hypothetical protein